jgi:hypothetical protein
MIQKFIKIILYVWNYEKYHFGDSPSNHHLILDYLEKMPDVSLIRVDNHEDLVRSRFGYCLPCADYMRKVFREIILAMFMDSC